MRINDIIAGNLIFALASSATAVAQEHEQDKAAGQDLVLAESHGGAITKSKEFHFEVLFHGNKILVYTYDHERQPMDPRGIQGRVRIEFANRSRKKIVRRLRYIRPKKAATQKTATKTAKGDHQGHESKRMTKAGTLVAAVDLDTVPEGEATAMITLTKLPGKAEREFAFKCAFKLGRLTGFVCAMKCTSPLPEKGKCPKCEMPLDTVRYIYACPMHPKVVARKAGERCNKCKMKLVVRSEAATPAKQGNDKHGGHKGRDHR